MKAQVLKAIEQPLQYENRPALQAGPGDVVVQLLAAALNRRDYWITQGKYPGIRLPVVLGSDGTGIVSQLGPGVAPHWKGREVILYPGCGWGTNPQAQGPEFEVLGMPRDGTLAGEVLVSAEQLAAKPAHLDWHQAAALPLAGLTAYRALVVQGGVQPGELVLVTGIGGGVATFAAQFAHALGAKVLATSSSDRKLAAAQRLGVSAGFNYRADDWATRLRAQFGSPGLIVDGTGGESYPRLLELIAPGGTIVNYGATAGAPPSFDLFRLFWKQIHIQGSTLGSPDDFQAMLELVHRKRITPVIDCVLSLAEANEALRRLATGEQFGKIVLRTSG